MKKIFIKNRCFFAIILLKNFKGDNKLNVDNSQDLAYMAPSFIEKRLIEIEEAKEKPSLLKKIKAVVNRFLLLFVSSAKKNEVQTTISAKITALKSLNSILNKNNLNLLDLFLELKQGITLEEISRLTYQIQQAEIVFKKPTRSQS